LAQVVGKALGGLVAELHREHGVGFRLGRGVAEIRPEEVVLDDGSLVPADLVVVGVGVIPRTALAEAAGLAVDRGIGVDDHLRTSDPNIWAAGDVARYPGPDGMGVRVEHWVLAERHGQAVARSMLGLDIPFVEPPFFWSQHYDLAINVTGHLAGWDEEVVVGEVGRSGALVGFRKGGTIRAVASIHRDRDSLVAEAALVDGDQAWMARLLEID
jgi:NADPH-dependent 2,4-dienoyl-CoA reductase/sulfur reductase-like enzyme